MNRISYLLFGITLLISLIGIFLLYESSSYNALIQIGDKYHFVKYQLVWLALGIFLCLLVSAFPYKRFFNLSLPSFVFTIFLLMLVFFPGIGLDLKGSHRWINLKYFVFQPSELLKITLTLYLAAWMSGKEKNRLLSFLIIFIGCLSLIALQPDLGSAVVVSCTSLALYFLSGARVREMLFITLFVFVLGLVFIKMESYRVARFSAFRQFDEQNLLSASYHVRQIIIALGSGGLTGIGLGKSIQKYAYLPESSTDSIFPILSEEAGFIGSIALISLFLLQFFLGFLIATRVKDNFGKLLGLGIMIFLTVQTLVNLASQVVLIPLTGVPLPFISYGGSSMVINFFAIGILLNISRYATFHK